MDHLKRIAAASLVALIGGTFSSALAEPEKLESALKELIADPFDVDAVERFAAHLPKINNPLNPNDNRMLIEGDIPIGLKGIQAYAMQKAFELKPVNDTETSNGELIYHLDNGNPARWDKSSRVLSYAIARSTFPDQQKFESVKNDVANATGDWEAVCPACGVDFQHNSAFDEIKTFDEFQAAATSKQITFIVVYTDSGGQFIASAFFPNDSWEKRMVLIDKSYFELSGGYTGRGVVRHELGHVLGYRHEHTRNVEGCYFEDNSWKPLTPYDAQSVMHYFCGGAGTLSLELSEKDKAGHLDFYTRSE